MVATASVAMAELKVASLSTVGSDLARDIGGDKVEVIELIKPGVDPHEFQPSPGDIKKIEKADLVLISGKGLEGYLAKLEETTGGAGKFVDLGSAVPSLKLEEDGKVVEDPHWWHSINNAQKVVALIAKRFAAADPANAAAYKANEAKTQAELKELNNWTKEEIAKLPKNKRKLVTSHDALQYFARDYGFTIYAVEGVSSQDEPSSQKVKELIDTIKSQGVKAIFFESIENPKVMKEITKETGAKVGGELYVDGLGDTEAKTYPDMIRYNVTTLVQALQ